MAAVTAVGVDPRLARSVRRWLRAYPPRWRMVHGEELFWLVVELAGPRARRVGARAAFDLVRGGWATRWRTHPPLVTWLLYRVLDRRIPIGYRAWAQDDIDGVLHPVRLMTGSMALVVLPFAVFTRDRGALWAPIVVVAVSVVFWPAVHRHRDLLKHVAPQAGEPLREGDLLTVEAPRDRLAAAPTATVLIGALGVLVPGAIVAAALGRLGTSFRWIPAGFEVDTAPVVDRAPAFVVLAVALVIGLWWARRADRRLALLLPARLPQPHRRLRRRPALGWTGPVVGAALGLVPAGAEVLGAVAIGPSVVLAVAALLMIPSAVVARERVRGVPDVAATDVWTILLRSEVPPVDGPLPALRPVEGPLPEGLVMPDWSHPPQAALG